MLDDIVLIAMTAEDIDLSIMFIMFMKLYKSDL